jgi:taurine--2-oxoglutarate transaminase
MLWVCPPLIINEAELSDGLNIVEEALAMVSESLVAETAAVAETMR